MLVHGFKILFLTFSVSILLTAKIHYVPANYPKIQLAINACQPGDTVILSEGLYYENLIITKNIVLASYYQLNGDSSHISRTIIDGSKYRNMLFASTIYITGGTDTSCIINGLTVQGGRGTLVRDPNDKYSLYSTGGGGINIVSASARIINNIIRDNHVIPADENGFTYGGGIGAIDTSLQTIKQRKIIIDKNKIIGNSSSGKWAESGGVALGVPAEIRNNTIMYNRTYSRRRAIGGGLGVYFIADYKILVEGNYICSNHAGLAGGFLISSSFERQGEAWLVNNIISNNHSVEVGGAGNVAERANAVFINNTITGNASKSKGGGLNIASEAYAVLINNILWKNLPDQISDWGLTQLNHNLIQGGLHGFGNIDSDPEFIPDDTLFRLSYHSPCISAGRRSLMLGSEQVSAPIRDFAGSLRMIPVNTDPDLGAVESPLGRTTEDEYDEHGDGYLRLYFNIRQAGKTERKQLTGQLISAAKMECTMFVNEKDSRKISRNDIPSFELPPGKNHFDLEISAYGRDSAGRLNVFIWLEGEDHRVILHRKSDEIFYHYWANLKPGKYTLAIQPQDDESIIGGDVFRASITVPPFWYQRWWAYALYAVIVLMAAVIYTRLRIINLKAKQELAIDKLQLEKLAEMDKLKSRFFANVTHELRTPLTLILGPAETLLNMKLKKEAGAHLALIKRNASRLLQLIDTLLQFIKVESGSAKLRVVRQDIVPVISRVVSYFASPAARKNISLAFNCEAETIRGMFDEEKIEQILQNILSNALKFTGSNGRIDVTISGSGSMLTIAVSDTGMGIKSGDKPHIFERFFRTDASHKIEGTGIGLSLTKELVELHHGTITLDSEEGKGTAVTVQIPTEGYKQEETAPIIPTEKTHPEFDIFPNTDTIPNTDTVTDTDTDTVEKPLILIAEDNDDTRFYVRTILSQRYTILEAGDGARALEKIKINIPDLIITDIMMPDMDGFELCREVKTDERTSHIPVVILSALAEKKDRMNGLHLGADDYLLKPFDAEELLTRVENLLETRRKLRENFSRKAMLNPGEVSVVSLDDKFLQRAVKIAEKHLSDEKFGVDQLAHEMFLSYIQFYRKIKALTNLSPVDFIRILRLERAKKLLETNWGNIADVADEVGFSNHSYFSKCFQLHFGILPHDVQKSHQNGKNMT